MPTDPEQPTPDTARIEVDPEEMVAAMRRQFVQRIAEIEERYAMRIVQLELVVEQLTRK